MLLSFLLPAMGFRQNRPRTVYPHVRRITCGKPVEIVDKPCGFPLHRLWITFSPSLYAIRPMPEKP